MGHIGPYYSSTTTPFFFQEFVYWELSKFSLTLKLKKERELSLLSPVFTRFVEVGRVAYVSYGPEFGKLCTIVDIIDGKRVLVDGPAIKRQQMALARLYLTDYVVDIKRADKTETVVEAYKAAEIDNKWAESSWAKKLAARAAKAAMTDFCRFKARYAKKH